MIQSLESKNDRHNLKLYSDKDLIKLCKHYQYSKDIPRWLYCAIRHRKIQDIAMRHIISLNPKRTFDEVQKEASKYKYRSDFQKNQTGLTNGRINTEFLTKFVVKCNIKEI